MTLFLGILEVAVTTPGGRPFVNERPINNVYAYDLAGFDKDGYLKIRLKDGTEQVINSSNVADLSKSLPEGETIDDALDITYKGTRTPIVNMGFTNTFNIYDFTLMFVATGYFGHVFRVRENYNTDPNRLNFRSGLENAWKVGDPEVTSVYSNPLPSNNTNYNNLNALARSYRNIIEASNVESASHIRLNEIYLGYNLPKSIFKNILFKNVSVYTQIRNIGVIWAANSKGIDPLFQRGRSVRIPVAYTFGLKINI